MFSFSTWHQMYSDMQIRGKTPHVSLLTPHPYLRAGWAVTGTRVWAAAIATCSVSRRYCSTRHLQQETTALLPLHESIPPLFLWYTNCWSRFQVASALKEEPKTREGEKHCSSLLLFRNRHKDKFAATCAIALHCPFQIRPYGNWKTRAYANAEPRALRSLLNPWVYIKGCFFFFLCVF